MTVINTNIAALRAQAGSNTAAKMTQTAMERLSTGKRINSAKDDAAGLAIASRMTSTVRGLAVAIRNANDGISLAQTAEGALGEVTNMLQRMKELAVQSANGTLGSSERAALQNETDQLVSQINDIAKTTDFNGIKLLDGNSTSLKLQTGTSAGDVVSLATSSVRTSDLGLTGVAGGVSTGRVAAGTYTTAYLTLNGVAALSASTVVASAKDLADGINANGQATGVKATAVNNVTTKVLSGPIAASAIKIGGKGVAASATLDDLVTNINNNNYGVTAKLNSDNTVTLSNTTGANIDLTGSSTSLVTTAGSITGYVTLESKTGSYISVGGSTAGLTAAGLNTSDGVSFSGVAVTPDVALAASTLYINGVAVPAAAATSSGTATTQAALYIAQINNVTAQTGVVATNTAGVITLASQTGGTVRVEGAGAATIGFNAQGGSAAMSAKLDISSQAAASTAMDVIDDALDRVSAKRGDLGALQNRLEVTVNNLTTSSTNLEDSRSRIEDADFSAETTNLAKSQILSQAATAMLAQANQSAQNVLSLLRS